jgi:exodeoxyribonuclease VII large subunit
MENILTLGKLLSSIEKCLKGQFSEHYWVRATIADLKFKNGHMYFELIDNDVDGDRKKARCKANCWNKTATKVNDKFLKQTGIPLKSSIEVLINVRVNFSIEHGFSLNVIDIDPQYTLGGIEVQIKEIREKLQEAQVYQNNLALPKPSFFTKIAVLAPENAAGLHDFKADVSPLDNQGLLTVDYYSSSFQGANAGNEMVYELREIYRKNQIKNYDCVVIIRGGGASLDLAHLNHFHLANACCRFPIPVFCGIGHASDKTIIDEVAFSFDTPSKVSKFIVETITSKLANAKKSIEAIHHEAIRYLNDKKNNLDVISTQTKNNTEQLLIKNKSQLEYFQLATNSIKEHVKVNLKYLNDLKSDYSNLTSSLLKNERFSLHLTTKDIHADIFREVNQKKSNVEQKTKEQQLLINRTILEHLNRTAQVDEQIQLAAKASIASFHDQLNFMVKSIIGFDVDSTIKQGFTIIRNKSDEIIKDGSQLTKNGIYTATFRDCEVYFQYKQ